MKSFFGALSFLTPIVETGLLTHRPKGAGGVSSTGQEGRPRAQAQAGPEARAEAGIAGRVET